MKAKLNIINKGEKMKTKTEPIKTELQKLDYKDIVSVSRTLELPDKIVTSVKFTDGTETKVALDSEDDFDDKEKAVMWCLLEKCFKSKRGLKRIINSVEDF